VRLHAVPREGHESCVAFRRSFDERLYNWEFDHFLEYGIEARGGRMKEGDQRLFVAETRKISKSLAALPQVFTHRDYQSRNLMVLEGTLHLIDFQDALLGPRQYDLVALFRDSYQDFEWDFVNRMIDHYLTLLGEDDSSDERDRFKKMFDWQTVQRKLKDAGRFVFIDRVKKNNKFLPNIPTSLRYAQEALGRQPELELLDELLKKYVPEFH
jgi:hypothetical protein